MPLLNGEIARVTAQLGFGVGDDVQNTWHLIKVSGANSDTAVALACQEFMELIYNVINPRISTFVLYNAIDIFFITGSQALGLFPWLTLVTGAGVGEPTAPGVCALGLARTGISKRIGKKYFGISTETELVGARWSAAYVLDVASALLLAYNNFVASNGVTLRTIVYDRTLAVARDAVSLVSEDNPAYQRRRRQGSGS